MTGPDAAKELRAIGCTAWIVGVTGNVLVEDVEYFKALGANDVLPKPVHIDRLQNFWAGCNDR